MNIDNLYQACVDQKLNISNHESDLYIEVTDKSRQLIKDYEHKSNVSTFINNVTKTPYFDAPFAFTPFWDSKCKKLTGGRINQI